MPFPPELASRVDGIRAKLRGGEKSTEVGDLKAKLAKREGMGGFKTNVEAIKARIAELEP